MKKTFWRLHNYDNSLLIKKHQQAYLSEGLGVGAHVSEDDKDVLLTLVGQVLRGGQSQAGGNDALNADWWRRNCVKHGHWA